jgi:hypothetical protein
MKGKPWPADDERKLKDWFQSGITDLSVLSFNLDGNYSKEGIRQKLISLGLLVEQQQQKNLSCCSSKLELPPELPTVEETLKVLAAALKALETPGLDKAEVLRLRGIISGCKIYKEQFADYLDYRGLEDRLIELEGKYKALVKNKKP